MSILLALLSCSLLPSVLSGACAFPDSGTVDVSATDLDMCEEALRLDKLLSEVWEQEEALYPLYNQSILDADGGPSQTWLDCDDRPPSPQTSSEESASELDEEQDLALWDHEWDEDDDTDLDCKAKPLYQERRIKLLQNLKKTEAVVWRKGPLTRMYDNKQQLFHADILMFMQSGLDIRKHGKGFNYFGTIDLSTCRPQKHVAEALFDILKTDFISQFDVAFALSSQGYRGENFRDFAVMESALIVAGVHPKRTQVIGKNGVNLTERLTALWDKTQSLPKECLNDHMQTELPYHRRMMHQLHKLKKTNVLDTLKKMKLDFIQSGGHCEQKQETLKTAVCKALSEKLNTPICIKKLSNEVTPVFRGKNGPLPLCEFRNRVLKLAFSGIPIVYDIEKKTVMLVDPAPKMTPPPAGTNFLTMVYDLCQLKNTLNIHEIAHYAHRMGYWQVYKGEDKKNIKSLMQKVKESKKLLAMLGLAHVDKCTHRGQKEMRRLRYLWETLPKNKGVFYNPSYYKEQCLCAVEQEELDALAQIQEFVTSHDYAVLVAYLKAKDAEIHQWPPEEKCIKDLLSGDVYLSEEALWEQYKRSGFGNKQNFWKVLKRLTTKKGLGRVIFDTKAGLFFWDPKSRFHERDTMDLQTTFFSLRDQCQGLSGEAMAFMMHQRGFKSVDKQNAHRLKENLQVLGLWDAEKKIKAIAQKRTLFNTILKQVRKEEPRVYTTGMYGLRWMVAWLGSGAMERLWKAYLEERAQREEDPPQAKRQRLTQEPRNPERIISEEIPELKKFLTRKRLWPTDTFTC